MAVYGHALIEQAFERAAKLRDQGFQCEVYTRSGYRCQVGMLLPESGAVQS
jgi:biotin operon repressor